MQNLYRLFLACLLLVPASGNTTFSVTAAVPGNGPRTDAPAPGMFLVASRTLQDRHFRKSVIYILRHNDEGTLGLIINKPGNLSLSHAVDDVLNENAQQHQLYYGGPVDTTVITMLIENEAESPLVEHIAGDIYFSNLRIVMDRLLKENKPAENLHFFHGHAGWTAGQLEQELAHGDWYLVEGDPETIFSSGIRTLWQRLINKVDPPGLIVRGTGRYD